MSEVIRKKCAAVSYLLKGYIMQTISRNEQNILAPDILFYLFRRIVPDPINYFASESELSYERDRFYVSIIL